MNIAGFKKIAKYLAIPLLLAGFGLSAWSSEYKKRDDLDKVEKMYRKSLAISEALGLKGVTANQYGNLGIKHYVDFYIAIFSHPCYLLF